MKLWKKITIAVPVVLVIGVGGYVLTHSGLGVNKNDLPKFVTANFIDLSKIYSISKFRSGAGHDFSGGGEICRSMKHYIKPQPDAAADLYMQQHQGFPAQPDGKTDIDIYAPFDGTITQIDEEVHPVGKQIYMIPDKASAFTVRLFHVYPVPGITAGVLGIGGTHVKAGQKIGVIAAHSDTDISVQIGNMPWNDSYVSVFDVMTDSVFSAYQSRGVTSKSDLIISKQYRDEHPLKCVGDKAGTFVVDPETNNLDAMGKGPDYFNLTGFVPSVTTDSQQNMSN